MKKNYLPWQTKTLCLLTVLLFLCKSVFTQSFHPEFWDGSGFFTVNKDSNFELPEWDNTMSYERLSPFYELIPLFETAGVTHIHKAFKTPALSAIYKIHFDSIAHTQRLFDGLKLLPYIIYAHKNPIFKLFYNPNDMHPNQWYLNIIEAQKAWDITIGNPNIKVAIVDDAVKISHPDLAPIIYHNPNEVLDGTDTDGNGFIDDIHGWDVADNNNNPEPPENHWSYAFIDMFFTHGTHCAGIAAAATDNNIGIASIGFGISIIPIKATRDNSILPLALDAGPEGIDYAIVAGADVINLSWGGSQNVPSVKAVIDEALNQGIIIVAAAGNDGNNTLSYPASYDGVVSVGATAQNDIIASFSQRNDKIDVMAPGENIWSTVRSNNSYDYLDGTSMAAPMVAGLIGLMMSFDASFTPSQIINCLKAGCDNIDSLNPLVTGLIGAGRINAHKALLCMQNTQHVQPHHSPYHHIFPNPAHDKIYIHLNEEKHETVIIEIFDLTGRLMLEQNIPPGTINTEADVQMLKPGVYIVRTDYNKNFYTEKLIIH